MRIFFLALVTVTACGGQQVGVDAGATPDGGSSDAGPPCSATEGCPQGMVCGYDESAGCAATTGECFTGGALCNTFAPGCACDGQIINVACTGLPSGYSTAPLLHTGLCDGGP